MSAASEPAPRTKSVNDNRPFPPRHTLFVPLLILLLGLGIRESSQVMFMEEQLDQTTQNVDNMDAKVKMAHYEQTKFYMMASEVLHLAPKDPNANQVSVLFGLRQLEADKPELMNASAPSDLAMPEAASGVTNIAPIDASMPTNAAPAPTNAAPAASPAKP